MAKDYKRGIDFRLYSGSGTWLSETWTEIQGVQDITVSANADDVSASVRGLSVGHLRGQSDNSFTFSLAFDKGDTATASLLTAMDGGTMVTLAIADGPIATAGTTYFQMQCVLMGRQLSAPAAGSPATYEVTAMRHLNSDYDLVVQVVGS